MAEQTVIAIGLNILPSSPSSVKMGRYTLETRNVAHVLVWVQANDEPEIQAAFEQTLAVRPLGPQAKELADRFFFETVVRVHRAGEGASFTGLKPAGRDLGPAIPAADQAVATGSVEPVFKLLIATIHEHLDQQFSQLLAAKAFEPGNVPAGREYVKAYVVFIHLVERLYESSITVVHGHFEETERLEKTR